MSDDDTAKTIEGIRALVSSDQFKALNDYKPPMNIFRMMDIHDDELVHSNILAWLLNPNESHGLGRRFLDGFLLELPNCEPSEKSEKEKRTLDKIVDALNSDPVIKREKYFVENPTPDQQESQSNPPTDVENSNNEKPKRTFADLVVDFPSAKIVIGIENKIWAGEQGWQVERYQWHLKEYYSDYSQRYVIFLSPFGKQPTTQDHNENRIPILLMSYNQIKKLVEDQFSLSAAPVKEFLEHIIHHFTENILGPTELQKLCVSLYRSFPETYEQMINSLPDLSDIRETYIQTIKEQNKDLRIEKLSWAKNETDWHEKGKMKRLTCICVRDECWVEDVAILLYISKRYEPRIFLGIGKRGREKCTNLKPVEVDYLDKSLDADQDWWWHSLSGQPIRIEDPELFTSATGKVAASEFNKLYALYNKLFEKNETTS